MSATAKTECRSVGSVEECRSVRVSTQGSVPNYRRVAGCCRTSPRLQTVLPSAKSLSPTKVTQQSYQKVCFEHFGSGMECCRDVTAMSQGVAARCCRWRRNGAAESPRRVDVQEEAMYEEFMRVQSGSVHERGRNDLG